MASPAPTKDQVSTQLIAMLADYAKLSNRVARKAVYDQMSLDVIASYLRPFVERQMDQLNDPKLSRPAEQRPPDLTPEEIAARLREYDALWTAAVDACKGVLAQADYLVLRLDFRMRMVRAESKYWELAWPELKDV